jgi:hypothetical protein
MYIIKNLFDKIKEKTMDDYSELKKALEHKTISNLFSQFNSMTFDENKCIASANSMKSVQKILEYTSKYNKWVALKTEKEKVGYLDDLNESILMCNHKLLCQMVYIIISDFRIDKELDTIDNRVGIDWNDKIINIDNHTHRKKYFYGTWIQLFEEQDDIKNKTLHDLLKYCDPKTSCIKSELEIELKNIEIIRKNTILSMLQISSDCKNEMDKIQSHKLIIVYTNYKTQPKYSQKGGWKLNISVEINVFPYIVHVSEYQILEYKSHEIKKDTMELSVKQVHADGWIDFNEKNKFYLI